MGLRLSPSPAQCRHNSSIAPTCSQPTQHFSIGQAAVSLYLVGWELFLRVELAEDRSEGEDPVLQVGRQLARVSPVARQELSVPLGEPAQFL